ncbi:MAG TPA: VWD domain-containing protein [Stellaceae bacterium]|nr:VWD domain-containing protein [Stellaceae bacterium]
MAFEIADARGLGADLSGQLVVYIESGSNPITEAAWETYTPDPGWILNTPRASQFDVLNVLGSPYQPAGVYTYYTDRLGYTWEAVSAVQNIVWPFNPDDYANFDPPVTSAVQAGYQLATPLPGTIQYNSNDKNHENIYDATDAQGNPKLQYYVTDPWGNVYILKSVNAANDTPNKVAAAVAAAVLPDGWTKSSGYLAEDTSYFPVYSGTTAHANEFRDSADSAWMQIAWGSSGITLAQQIGNGVPIWGGNADGLVLGTPNDDEIHGGAGNDTILGLGGDDRIAGDAGDDTIRAGAGTTTAVFSGPIGQYEIVRLRDGSLSVSDTTGNDGTDTLVGVQKLEFSDGVVAADSVAQNTASSTGDPHLVTFDGAHYDLYAAGAFKLVESTTADGMDVQVQTAALPQGFFNTAVAASFDAHTVAFDAAGNVLFIDGEARSLATLDGRSAPVGDGAVRVEGNDVTVDFSTQDRLMIHDAGDSLDIGFTLAAYRAPGTVQGLLGDADGNPANDPHNADGAAAWHLDPAATLLTVLGPG